MMPFEPEPDRYTPYGQLVRDGEEPTNPILTRARTEAERISYGRGYVAGINGRHPEIDYRPLTYLAAPYSHPDRAVRVARFETINKVAAELMRRGLLIYSPISHTHPIAEAGDLPLGWDFWQTYDRAFILHSKRVIVLMLHGWMQSKGVNAEIAIAEEAGIPVEYKDTL